MQLMAEMSRGGGGGGEEEGVASEADQLREAIERLQHDLMKLEMHLVEQIDVGQRSTHSYQLIYYVCS